MCRTCDRWCPVSRKLAQVLGFDTNTAYWVHHYAIRAIVEVCRDVLNNTTAAPKEAVSWLKANNANYKKIIEREVTKEDLDSEFGVMGKFFIENVVPIQNKAIQLPTIQKTLIVDTEFGLYKAIRVGQIDFPGAPADFAKQFK